jgi:hypothetical protein
MDVGPAPRYKSLTQWRGCWTAAANPNVSNKQFPEAAKLEAEGLHTIMGRGIRVSL